MPPNALLDRVLATRDASQLALDAILDTAEAEARDLTADESAEFTRLSTEIADADARAGQLRANDERRASAEEARQALDTGDGVVTLGDEPRTYARGNGQSFLLDQCRGAAFQDLGAEGRLLRHAREFEVEAARSGTWENTQSRLARFGAQGQQQLRTGLTTVDGAGGTFVPPEYLINEFVAFLREARPFADACNVQDLPTGTNVVYLPKVLTGTSVAPQATQNTAISETDLTDEYISASVQTYAGAQTISLQLIEQSPINFDEIVFQDLIAALGVAYDTDCINGSGSSGHVAGVLGLSGINAVTFTSGSPTGVLLFPFIAQALAEIRKNRKAAATHIWMTPERWYWLASQTDSNGRPLVVPSDQGVFAMLASMSDKPVVYEAAGTILGVPVYLDSNLPYTLGGGTNQDPVIVAKMNDLYSYEGAITSRALPQTLGNQLSVLLQVYQYAAFLNSRYPVSIAAINGTGLVTPTF